MGLGELVKCVLAYLAIGMFMRLCGISVNFLLINRLLTCPHMSFLVYNGYCQKIFKLFFPLFPLSFSLFTQFLLVITVLHPCPTAPIQSTFAGSIKGYNSILRW